MQLVLKVDEGFRQLSILSIRVGKFVLGEAANVADESSVASEADEGV